MKLILFFFLFLSFCFVTFANDTDILIDDLSAGTEIILDDNMIDNNEDSQEFSVDAPEIEIEESATIDEETLPGADPVALPVQEVQQTEIHQTVPEVVKTKQTITQPQPKDSSETIYTVQLGAFKARERAFAFHWKISKSISNTRVDVPTTKNKLYRVCCGTFPNYSEAKAKSDKLKKQNIKCFVAKATSAKK